MPAPEAVEDDGVPGGTVSVACALLVGGAVWAWVYHRTRSLAATWLSHALVDAAILMVGYDLLFGRG